MDAEHDSNRIRFSCRRLGGFFLGGTDHVATGRVYSTAQSNWGKAPDKKTFPWVYALISGQRAVDNSGFVVGERGVLVIDAHINGAMHARFKKR